jgi:hypothetical protein
VGLSVCCRNALTRAPHSPGHHTTTLPACKIHNLSHPSDSLTATQPVQDNCSLVIVAVYTNCLALSGNEAIRRSESSASGHHEKGIRTPMDTIKIAEVGHFHAYN